MLSVHTLFFLSSFCALAMSVFSFDIIIANWVVPVDNDNGGSEVKDFRPPPRSATVGDTITFLAREDHGQNSNKTSVYLHTYGATTPCDVDEDGSVVYVGEAGPDGSARHVFAVADAEGDGVVVFRSSARRCGGAEDSVLVVRVRDNDDGATTSTPPRRVLVDDWSVRSIVDAQKSLPPRVALVGDVAEFVWWDGIDAHDVWRLSRRDDDDDDRCRSDGDETPTPVGFVPGSQYVFTDDDARRGKVAFGCLAHHGVFCDAGLRMTFRVYHDENEYRESYKTSTSGDAYNDGVREEPTRAPYHVDEGKTSAPQIDRSRENRILGSAFGGILLCMLSSFLVIYLLDSHGVVRHKDTKPYPNPLV